MGIQGAPLTHHPNAMESSGLLIRRRDPGNRRVHIVELTEAGRSMFVQLPGTVTSFDKRLRNGLDEADVAALWRLLAVLRHNVGSSEAIDSAGNGSGAAVRAALGATPVTSGRQYRLAGFGLSRG